MPPISIISCADGGIGAVWLLASAGMVCNVDSILLLYAKECAGSLTIFIKHCHATLPPDSPTDGPFAP
ncbi:hypothetical protein Absy_023_024 [Acetobacter syzygii]|nr:hypothetical protein Absy_023_024 [Acetobacter syzygii]